MPLLASSAPATPLLQSKAVTASAASAAASATRNGGGTLASQAAQTGQNIGISQAPASSLPSYSPPNPLSPGGALTPGGSFLGPQPTPYYGVPSMPTPLLASQLGSVVQLGTPANLASTAYNNQLNILNAQDAGNTLQLNAQKDYLQKMLGTDAAPGLSAQQLDLAWQAQADALNRQRAQAGIAAANANDAAAGIDRQKQYLMDKLGLQNQDFDAQGNYIGQQKGMAQKVLDNLVTYRQGEYANQVGQAALTRDIGTRSTISDATARGATGAFGTQQSLADIAKQYGISEEQARLIRDYRLGEGHNQFDATNQSLDFQNTQLGLNRQGAQLDYANNQASLDEQKRQLQRQAASAGMSAAGYSAALDYGLKKLGLDKQVSTAQLIAALQGNNGQALARAQQIEQLAFQTVQATNTRGAN